MEFSPFPYVVDVVPLFLGCGSVTLLNLYSVDSFSFVRQELIARCLKTMM